MEPNANPTFFISRNIIRCLKIPKNPDLSQAEATKQQKKEQAKIDAAEPLTEEEQPEREELLTKGFSHWTRRDFTQFVKANEKFGRGNVDGIAQEIEGKKSEIQKKVFFLGK